MGHWHRDVSIAEQFFQSVEQSLHDNCISFNEVLYYPWQSNGGRSNGITACFNKGFNCFYISLYEYWNSDEICLQFNQFGPCSMDGEKHDTPHLKYSCDKLHIASLAVQIFLIYWFEDKLPKELYYGRNFGIVVANHDEVNGAHDDITDKVLNNHFTQCGVCDNFVKISECHKHGDDLVCKKCWDSQLLK